MRISHLACLFLLLFCCCKGRDAQVSPDPNFNFEYTAKYDSVITITANSSTLFIFNIDVENGNIADNKLSCSISKLPGNVTVTPVSMVVGLIKGGVFTFSTGDIAPRVDTLLFTISSKATGSHTRKLILKIVPPPDNAPKLVGTYDSCYDFCAPVVYKHSSVVTTDTAYGITISNLNMLGSTFVVKAKVSDIVIIPYQVVSGKKIWGRGAYIKDESSGSPVYRMEIKDTIVTGLDTICCTAHIEH